MKPILYSLNQTTFAGNGLGVLSDVFYCRCTEILNGSYELEFGISKDSLHAAEIQSDCIVKVRPNYLDDPQLFRIYLVQKDLEGNITAKAAHISYDTAGIPIRPFTSETLSDAVSHMNTDRILLSPSKFVLTSNFSSEGTMAVESPESFRKLLGGSDDSIISVYGGEYHYDNYTIELLYQRGVDKGICFRYGKNITSFELENSSEELYTAVIGYWKKSGDKEKNEADILIYGNIIECEGEFPYDKILILDTSDKIKNDDDSSATVDQIDDYVKLYIAQNSVGIPKNGMKINYVDDANITKIGVGDRVGIIFPDYRINGVARCTKCVFDCLLERNESIEIGVVSTGIETTISDIAKRS